MDNLIKIEEREGKQVVNARDLHEFLEVKTRFSIWISRQIKDFSFIENQDFVMLKNVHPENQTLISKGMKIAKEYVITLNMAKELSMLARSDKGKQARKYFIECELKLKEQSKEVMLPQNYLEALKALVVSEEHKLKLETKIKEDKPKVDAYDKLMTSEVSISFGQFARLIGIGRNKLFEMCRQDEILIYKGCLRNSPYQKYIDAGYFEVIEDIINVNEEKSINTIQTLITPKGQDYLTKKYSIKTNKD